MMLVRSSLEVLVSSSIIVSEYGVQPEQLARRYDIDIGLSWSEIRVLLHSETLWKGVGMSL